MLCFGALPGAAVEAWSWGLQGVGNCPKPLRLTNRPKTQKTNPSRNRPPPSPCKRNLFDYDQVVNTQRDKIYSERRRALLAPDLGPLMVGGVLLFGGAFGVGGALLGGALLVPGLGPPWWGVGLEGRCWRLGWGARKQHQHSTQQRQQRQAQVKETCYPETQNQRQTQQANGPKQPSIEPPAEKPLQ